MIKNWVIGILSAALGAAVIGGVIANNSDNIVVRFMENKNETSQNAFAVSTDNGETFGEWVWAISSLGGSNGNLPNGNPYWDVSVEIEREPEREVIKPTPTATPTPTPTQSASY